MATIVLVAFPTYSLADIEHIELQKPCNGKFGRAIVSYSWIDGTTIEKENLFSDLCLDLDAMKVYGVETSDELEPAYQAPGQMIYHLYPQDHTDSYQETVVLSTDILFHHDDDQAIENLESLPRPEEPGVLSTFTWVTGGHDRPLERIGLGTAWLRGFVGGEQPESKPQAGSYAGSAEHMLSTNEADSKLSGVGFYLGANVEVAEEGAEVKMRSPAQVATVREASAYLTLDFEGDEITGTGTFQAENALLSPTTDRVWKHFDLQAAAINGKLTGKDGDHMYVLVIWEGSYTDFAGDSYPADSVMTFNARLQKEDQNEWRP